MKIWRTIYGHDNGCNGQGIGFFATKREAQKLLTSHDDQFGHIDPHVEKIDVPTTKAALIAFLNRETSPLTQ